MPALCEDRSNADKRAQLRERRQDGIRLIVERNGVAKSPAPGRFRSDTCWPLVHRGSVGLDRGCRMRLKIRSALGRRSAVRSWSTGLVAGSMTSAGAQLPTPAQDRC